MNTDLEILVKRIQFYKIASFYGHFEINLSLNLLNIETKINLKVGIYANLCNSTSLGYLKKKKRNN